MLFSPIDSTTLFFASNTLWSTRDGGRSWTQRSPDLTRRDSVVPDERRASTPRRRRRWRGIPGVIYTVAPSPVSARWIWAGTDDGLIHVTRNGGPHLERRDAAGAGAWAKVSLIDASPHDSLTAYAAINTFRLDDLRPHIWRTHDGGKTWTHITNGIPDGGIVNAVREDPRRRGLLYAGTERTVYVSFDDGDHWQSLRTNLPATSIRDLVIKDDDLVVGTHGRGFWILDDVTPLRQLTAEVAAAAVHLFRPQTATRVRWNMYTDTPMPQEEPAGQNPPDGAILTYRLARDARGPVTLEILDAKGALVRRYSSDDRAGAAGRGTQHPRLLDPAAAAAVRRRRQSSLRVGPQACAPRGGELQLPDRGGVSEYGEGAAGIVGSAGTLHRASHRGRHALRAAAGGANGSAGEDAACGARRGCTPHRAGSIRR